MKWTPGWEQAEGETDMRFVWVLLGIVLGTLIGAMGSFLLLLKVAGDDLILGGVLLVAAIPLSIVGGPLCGCILASRILDYFEQHAPDAKSRGQKAFLAAGLAAGIPALLVGLYWSIAHHNDPPPDRQMLVEFSQHRAEFDHLAAMVQADKKLERVDENWTQPDNPQKIGVSPARISEYRRRLSGVGVPRGFEAFGGPQVIKFLYWGHGSAISSDTDKGFAHLAFPPAKVLNSLDQCQPDEHNGVLAYRHIEGHWYLYYGYMPD